jgi:hypothetical protein
MFVGKIKESTGFCVFFYCKYAMHFYVLIQYFCMVSPLSTMKFLYQALSFFYILLCGCTSAAGDSIFSSPDKQEIKHSSLSFEKLKKRAKEARTFCLRNKMNTDICLLADMSVHSGKERFVVWSFSKDTILTAGLVSHGCSDYSWGKDQSKDSPVFSNTHDSHCSSLGKYKIGERGYSQWGIHVKYLMHGLEVSNSNALSRVIVLHGWDAIEDHEVYPDGTPEGWGCPAISNKFMTTLDGILKDRKRPVLLWAFE